MNAWRVGRSRRASSPPSLRSRSRRTMRPLYSPRPRSPTWRFLTHSRATSNTWRSIWDRPPGFFSIPEGIMMRSLDRLFEDSSRSLAQRTSRRSVLAALGRMLTGAALLPLLPIDRSSRAGAAEPSAAGIGASAKAPVKSALDNPESCEYWKYCAIDGFLCSCCGGTSHSCPPGTAPSPIPWIGPCHNPSDGRDYIVSYNDCCGKTSCSNCYCNRNEREKPMYRLSRNNDVNWCMANADANYHCSVSVILGVAEQ